MTRSSIAPAWTGQRTAGATVRKPVVVRLAVENLLAHGTLDRHALTAKEMISPRAGHRIRAFVTSFPPREGHPGRRGDTRRKG